MQNFKEVQEYIKKLKSEQGAIIQLPSDFNNYSNKKNTNKLTPAPKWKKPFII